MGRRWCDHRAPARACAHRRAPVGGVDVHLIDPTRRHEQPRLHRQLRAVAGAVRSHAPPARPCETHGSRDVVRRASAHDDRWTMSYGRIEAGDFLVVLRGPRVAGRGHSQRCQIRCCRRHGPWSSTRRGGCGSNCVMAPRPFAERCSCDRDSCPLYETDRALPASLWVSSFWWAAKQRPAVGAGSGRGRGAGGAVDRPAPEEGERNTWQRRTSRW